MRLFAAVDLSSETREAIAAEQQRIRTALGESGGSLKWVGAGNAHLTLVFLGQVDAAAVPLLADDFSCDIALPPFEIAVSGLGMFPERGAPRVLWLGIGAGAGSLIALQRAVAVRVAAHGVALEARDFHPHLTLARWGASRPADR
ncbi:MAG: hypothetical protein JWL71_3725, partial [Acidobacteria bacterium]|nr:hypothetical protein [Acidobacteriota bacterium]